MLQALESAAFSAWPSQHCIDSQGWFLRLDRGYTKRANSANATAHSRELTGSDVDAIETRFRDSGLVPIFRLTSFAPIENTDRLLDSRGYQSCDASLVMARSIEGVKGTDQACAPDATSWLDAFQKASGKRGADQAVHLEILHRIAAPRAWAVHSESEPDLSCGLGVLVDDKLGLFDLATRAEYQRRGFAQNLCEGLLAWGAHRGARTAFLQVVATNTSAIRLYEKLGFKIAYRYWYRIAEA
jgi:ribosomal protein S18 acetylase RimI-like enzyme